MIPGGEDRSSTNAGGPWRVTRREALAALGGAALVSPTYAVEPTTVRRTPVHVRVYPGDVPRWVRLSYGLEYVRRDWVPPFRAALTAVEHALEQVLSYANDRSRLEGLEARVGRGGPIRLSLSAASRPSDVVAPSLETILSGFGDRLRERDALTGSTCHLLLRWSPLNYRIGYGGTTSPYAAVGDESEGGGGDALTVVNVGATERWDSRAVTRNMAIHEALHTFLSDDVVESVAGAPCDHHLGTAVRTDDETLRVSPMATAYAGPDELGGGTRFHGTGCADHERFFRHDGHEGVERWAYTTSLSEATLEAVTRYLERNAD